jgi:protein-S-isoprenylcysteine O-methyltransferase Ste14
MLPTRRASGHRAAAPLVFAWGGAALFVLSLLVFLHAYLVRFGAPAAGAPLVRGVALDVSLFSAFALHHSLLARTAMKARVSRLASPTLERSLYTWVASALLVLVCVLWQPVPGELYHATGAAAVPAFAVQALGILITIRSSARLDVLDLAGVRPLLAARPGATGARVPLATTGLYGFVRHPLYFGWILFVFGTPHMTLTRLVFALVSTIYLALAVPFEERGLVGIFGDEYRAYQARVRWRVVRGLY